MNSGILVPTDKERAIRRVAVPQWRAGLQQRVAARALAVAAERARARARAAAGARTSGAAGRACARAGRRGTG